MRVFIDDKEVELGTVEATEDIASIIKSFEEKILKEGKVFTQIKINNEIINDDNRDKFLSLNVSNINEISFKTANPRKLAIEALNELSKYLPKLREGALSVSSLISVGEYEKAYSLFSKVIEGINWFVKLMKTIPPVTGVKFSDIVYKGENVSVLFENFEGIMRDLLNAFETTL